MPEKNPIFPHEVVSAYKYISSSGSIRDLFAQSLSSPDFEERQDRVSHILGNRLNPHSLEDLIVFIKALQILRGQKRNEYSEEVALQRVVSELGFSGDHAVEVLNFCKDFIESEFREWLGE